MPRHTLGFTQKEWDANSDRVYEIFRKALKAHDDGEWERHFAPESNQPSRPSKKKSKKNRSHEPEPA